MSDLVDEAERVQTAFSSVVRELGLLRPDTTPCGQPISVAQAHALGELHERGPLTQQEMASALRVQKSTVSRLVDQLESDRLATRAPNPADGRSVLISLTSNGRRRAERLADARRELFVRLLDQLDDDARRSVVEGLSHLEEAARVAT